MFFDTKKPVKIPRRKHTKKSGAPLYKRIEEEREQLETLARGNAFQQYVRHTIRQSPDKDLLLPKKGSGVLGKADGPSYQWQAARTALWTRKELRNRLRWLKGELTRLIVSNKNGTNLKKVLERRKQIQTYSEALEKYKDQHRQVRREKHNDRRRVKRARERAEKTRGNYKRWKAERKAKYGAVDSRFASQKEPKKRPPRQSYISYLQQLGLVIVEED
jgi:hypothetical protein